MFIYRWPQFLLLIIFLDYLHHLGLPMQLKVLKCVKKKEKKIVKKAQNLHGQKAIKGHCSNIFLTNMKLAFYKLIGSNLMYFPILMMFSLIQISIF